MQRSDRTLPKSKAHTTCLLRPLRITLHPPPPPPPTRAAQEEFPRLTDYIGLVSTRLGLELKKRKKLPSGSSCGGPGRNCNLARRKLIRPWRTAVYDFLSDDDLNWAIFDLSFEALMF